MAGMDIRHHQLIYHLIDVHSIAYRFESFGISCCPGHHQAIPVQYLKTPFEVQQQSESIINGTLLKCIFHILFNEYIHPIKEIS